MTAVDGEVFIELIPEGTHFDFRSPYDEEFIHRLKQAVPPHFRSWRSGSRKWRVARSHWEAAKRLIEKHYTIIRYSPAAEAAEMELLEDMLGEPDLEAYFTMGLRSDAEEVVIHAAMLVLEWEITNSGDTSAFAALVEAYERICAHRRMRPLNAGWLRLNGPSLSTYIAARTWNVVGGDPTKAREKVPDSDDD